MNKIATVLAAVAVAGTTALGLAATASATPQEDAVVQQMNDAGYHLDAQAEVHNAHKVCDQLGRGYPEPHVVDLITPALNNDRAEAQAFFNISRANLCP